MRFRLLAFALLCGALVVASFDCAPLGAQQPKAEERFTRTEAMVPMRDGTKLFTTLHVPKDPKGDLPIILLRTPYGIDGRTDRLLKSYF
ncbi:MAG: glutaryl-7-ACA acylase, partial [Gemmata sp.]